MQLSQKLYKCEQLGLLHFRCRQMITGDCAEVSYWVTLPSAQAHFCFILALNLQFIHDGKPKIFTGAITTYQPMKGTSSVSLWHFCPCFGVLALFNTSDPSCVHQLWIPVCYEVYVVGIFVMIATLLVMFLKKEYCVAVAMVLKCLELDFTET